MTNKPEPLDPAEAKKFFRKDADEEHEETPPYAEPIREGSNDQKTNLILCPDCNSQVSKRAESCPNCGCPIRAMIRGNVSQGKKKGGQKTQTSDAVAGCLGFLLGPVGLWYKGHFAAGFAWLLMGFIFSAATGGAAAPFFWIGMAIHAYQAEPIN